MQFSKIKVIIPICDDNLWLLPILRQMYTKYWTEDCFEFHILGFKEPEPDFVTEAWRHQWFFHSLDSSQKGGAQSWSKYIANYLKTLDDELIIFALEDFIPTGKFNLNLCADVINWCVENRNKPIGRFELGWDTMMSVDHDIVHNFENGSIIEAKQNAMYRISTQTSLWNRKYLIKYMDRRWTPWQFEIDGSIMSTGDQTCLIVGCFDLNFQRFPAKWIHKGSISRLQPGKFNILGMKLDDVKLLCDNNLIKEEQLIMGQWAGYVPTFNECGGFNFDFNKFRNIESIKQYTKYNWKEYEGIYC